ncbi:hypothetical protein Desca_0982 [Desulfotomaculum nigrificans CO-1-SRB]|uniref:Uncharacterized protein n=1 Tax=Desulfotomaculum nigrificans (strain DSM 14880 / VKM B-2319 / CO-1-SRB) TaxID=868595 RepID=F6B2M7_DESCC|nr:hypothetical protein [Desulfotomaculum nigrificans]AEF93856.1 hypothetical protein Desca_0982 [Desulfotomaculum nigrificans CO-1-SRB]
MSDVNALGLLLALYGTIAMVTMGIGLGLYLLYAFGLYRMAERAKVENSWFSFIPILQNYIIGKLIGQMKVGSWVIPRLEWVLVIIPIAAIVLGLIPVIGTITNILFYIFWVMVTYNLFRKYSHHAVIMTVIGIILPFLYPIFIFVIRNADPIRRN